MKQCSEADETNRVSLVAGWWYAWEMIPGYTLAPDFDPYVSPIYLERVIPMKTGKRLLKLTFNNAFDADGVQDFELTVRVVIRGSSFIVASLDTCKSSSVRCAIIGTMSFAWLQSHLTSWFNSKVPHDMPEPCRSDPQRYLNHRLRGIWRVRQWHRRNYSEAFPKSGGEVFLEENGEPEYFGLVDSVNVLEVLPDGRFFMVWRSACFYENDHGAHTPFVQDAPADKGDVGLHRLGRMDVRHGRSHKAARTIGAVATGESSQHAEVPTRIANQTESARMIVDEMKANPGLWRISQYR
jgi:hypothetical protein